MDFCRELKGVVKTVTVSRNRAGQYFASIRLEVDPETPVTQNGVVTGIDLGIKEFAITYNGNQCSKYDNPRHTEKHARNLKRKQQKLARKKPDSNRRKKARLLVAKVYNKIHNTRHDFLHKLSRTIVDTSEIVVVENLHVKGMVKKRRGVARELGSPRCTEGQRWVVHNLRTLITSYFLLTVDCR